MDWSKAKTILIIAMIFTNLILIWAYFEKTAKDETLTPDYIEETRRMLEDYGIDVDCEIPKDSEKAACPYVSEDILDPDKINENFFEGKGNKVKVSEGNLVISLGSETVSISDGNVILYTNSNPREKINDFNEKTAIEACEKFAKERNEFPRDAVFELIRQSGENYRVFYVAENMLSGKRMKLEDSHLEFVVSREGVIRMSKSWIRIAESGQNPIFFISASKILRSLTDDETLKGKKIIEISPCCYWNKSEWGRETMIESVRGVSSPAWRVLFSDGEERILTSR